MVSSELPHNAQRSSRGVLVAVLLLACGLVAGALLGRSMATTNSSSTPSPTVAVTAPPPDGTTVWPDGPLTGPPDSLADLAALPPYSGRVKDRTLAQGNGGS